MRTDSINLSQTALTAARNQIAERYGADFLPDGPRTYNSKVKNAQEAHEAIRPAGESFRTPDEVKSRVGGAEARVYDLIYKRTLASQMTDAVGETVSVRIGGQTPAGRAAEFATSGTIITHLGYQKAYIEGSDDESANESDTERRLPSLAEGDRVDERGLEPQGHETQPPSRYTEASLVKRLEELGVGRPSTYASIISTIQDRGYVWKKGSALVPSFTAFAVVTLLEDHFPDLVDYAFTARMEDDLDEIAGGQSEAVPWLSNFYFGNGTPGLKSMVNDRLGDIDARAINSIPLGVDADGREIVARVGRYGPYLSRGEDTASIPEDLPPDELSIERATELLEAPSGERVLGTHPDTGLPVVAKAGRFGPYIQMGEHDDDTGEKPRTASLFKTMSLESVTFDDAIQLLTLPRIVGQDPADGEPIEVTNGRYGPYLKKGKETRSLETEDQLFTVTLDDCLRLLAEPKRRRGAQSAPPLRELGEDPNTGKAMVIKDGRFGPYVTDGETNASLRKGDTVEEITIDRGAELLADRRARGPAKKKAKKKAPAKKKKKAPAKKKKAKKKAPAKKQKAPAQKAAPTAGRPGGGTDEAVPYLPDGDD
jgi:DNA topoisomerase-1